METGLEAGKYMDADLIVPSGAVDLSYGASRGISHHHICARPLSAHMGIMLNHYSLSTPDPRSLQRRREHNS